MMLWKKVLDIVKTLIFYIIMSFWRFRILELQNRVMQNDVTLRVINSKLLIEIVLSSY